MEQANVLSNHGDYDGVIIHNAAEEEDEMNLPPGFRFHPTDEELITHYLSKKVVDASFDPRAIGEVDLNKSEPWELPRRAKLGEKEWYFFCLRDRKYLTGLRTNRATGAGYWKATGKDKEIYRGKLLVGMKKTLVFYRGRAPRGEKSNWVMHEYRLMEAKYSIYSLPTALKNEWVICRVIKKVGLIVNGKKPFASTPKTCSAHVTCFSSPPMMGQKAEEPERISPANYTSADNSSPFFSRFTPAADTFYGGGGGFLNLLEGDCTAKLGHKIERDMLSISHLTGFTSDMNPEISSGFEFARSAFEECLWNC